MQGLILMLAQGKQTVIGKVVMVHAVAKQIWIWGILRPDGPRKLFVTLLRLLTEQFLRCVLQEDQFQRGLSLPRRTGLDLQACFLWMVCVMCQAHNLGQCCV